ncbi:MAG: hydroxymethylbilane synthase [Gammaproteobacteria bacterium]|nr:hydroxymethylbilane synthase [Gammaproteobacteria bacterium]
MKIRIATRKSPLALVQTHLVKALLLAQNHALQVELVEVLTEGDRIQDRTLAEIGGKGLFIKKLEEMLLADQADIAVHSLKDVPPALDGAFCLAAVLPRHSPFDVLVSPHYSSLEALPIGARIGTSSVRRQAALLHVRPDLNIQMIRGNVDTRLKKLDAGEYDALILAAAGLGRLGLGARIRQILPLEICLPSVAQGVIGIECLAERTDLYALLRPLNQLHFTCRKFCANS